MLIRYKSKKCPEIGDVRIKRKFVFYHAFAEGIAILQFIYLKQKFKCEMYCEGDYDRAATNARTGRHYKKQHLKFGKWHTICVYPRKADVFVDAL